MSIAGCHSIRYFCSTFPHPHGTDRALASDIRGMEKSIFRFVLRYSRRQQVVILLLTLASFPFLTILLNYLSRLSTTPLAARISPKEFFGFEFDQVPYLMLLSGLSWRSC